MPRTTETGFAPEEGDQPIEPSLAVLEGGGFADDEEAAPSAEPAEQGPEQENEQGPEAPTLRGRAIHTQDRDPQGPEVPTPEQYRAIGAAEMIAEAVLDNYAEDDGEDDEDDEDYFDDSDDEVEAEEQPAESHDEQQAVEQPQTTQPRATTNTGFSDESEDESRDDADDVDEEDNGPDLPEELNKQLSRAARLGLGRRPHVEVLYNDNERQRRVTMLLQEILDGFDTDALLKIDAMRSVAEAHFAGELVKKLNDVSLDVIDGVIDRTVGIGVSNPNEFTGHRGLHRACESISRFLEVSALGLVRPKVSLTPMTDEGRYTVTATWVGENLNHHTVKNLRFAETVEIGNFLYPPAIANNFAGMELNPTQKWYAIRRFYRALLNFTLSIPRTKKQ